MPMRSLRYGRGQGHRNSWVRGRGFRRNNERWECRSLPAGSRYSSVEARCQGGGESHLKGFRANETAARLARGNAHQRTALHLDPGIPVDDGIGTFFHQEEAIDTVLIETVPAVLKFVIMDDAHQWMQLRRTHKAGVIIDTLNIEDFSHTLRSYEKSSRFRKSGR